jgi:hypothetical protein
MRLCYKYSISCIYPKNSNLFGEYPIDTLCRVILYIPKFNS